MIIQLHLIKNIHLRGPTPFCLILFYFNILSAQVFEYSFRSEYFLFIGIFFLPIVSFQSEYFLFLRIFFSSTGKNLQDFFPSSGSNATLISALLADKNASNDLRNWTGPLSPDFDGGGRGGGETLLSSLLIELGNDLFHANCFA